MRRTLQGCFTSLFFSASSLTFSNPIFKVAALLVAILVLPGACHALPAPTTQTTLVITSGGNATSNIAHGDLATLTATIKAGSFNVPAGQVNFCDASATYCTDVHILGTAQITSGGTAILRLSPAVGSHSYRAVFLGTKAFTASASSPSSLTVSGLRTSTTVLTSTGTAGTYSLSAVVTGLGTTPLSSTGSVSFTDSIGGGTLLGSATIGTVTSTFGLSTAVTPDVTGIAIAVADFNQDGWADLVAVNSTGSVTVLLGIGDGTFNALPAAPLLSYTYIGKIAVGDFNSDGNSDLAVTGSADNVTVLLGKGDGTFNVAAVVATGNGPSDIAVADWNEDGILDLAVTNGGESSMAILLGNGDGTFNAGQSISTARAPGKVLAGDFNNDGNPDIAVLTYSDYAVTTFAGTGDGTFAAGMQTMKGFDVTSIAACDFNGDGKTDLAVSMAVINSVFLYMGNGDQTFSTGKTISAGSFPSSLVVADYNGDGIADLGTVSSNSNNTAGAGPIVLLGKGDGNFTTSGSTGTYSNSLATGDFNNDGFSDLIYIKGYSGDASAAILLGGSTNAATAILNPVSLAVGTHQVTATFAGDSIYSASTSPAITVTVPKTTTGLSLSATPSSITYGAQVVLTATLSPYTTQNQSSNGETITFRSGSTVLGTGILSLGVATLNLTSVPASTNNLKAIYAGDTYLSAAISTDLPFIVAKATPKITWAALSPVTYGTAISADWLNATASVPGTFSYSPIAGFVPAAGTRAISASFNPTDISNYASAATTNTLIVNKAPLTVTAANATRPYGSSNPIFSVTSSGSVNNDTFTLSAISTATSTSSPGSYSIVPTILGSSASSYAISSINGTLIVTKAASTTNLTSSSASPMSGANITFTATVAPSSTGTPTGSIVFYNGTTLLANAPLVGNTAAYSTNLLLAGSYGISAIYAGDSNFASSNAAITQVVTAPPDFTVGLSSTAATVKAGQSTNLTVTAVPLNNFNQQLALSCVGLPAFATCNFSPATLTPNEGSPVSSELTIATTASGTAMLKDGKQHKLPWNDGPAAAILAALVFVLPARSRQRTWKVIGLCLLLIGLTCFPLIGCSSPTNSVITSPGTPSGSSQVSIVATASGSSQKLAVITLTVSN